MKKIVKNFNNFVKNTIFKVQNKTNNKFKISGFNKILITFISLLFLYIFYLLTPVIYDKNWVKDKIQTKLLSEFKINLSSIDNISYLILPAPHFLIKDSELLLTNLGNEKSIGEIKNFQIFLSQLNFFDKEKIRIKNIIIDKANFSLSRNDLNVLNNSTNNKLASQKININKSNLFFKSNLDEIVTIIKIDKAEFFFNDKELENQFILEGGIFGIPFTSKLKIENNLIIEKNFLFKAKSLNLDILNNHIIKKNNSIVGNNAISLFNSTIDTGYELIDENIIFKSKNSIINNSKINYDGKLSINPFDLDLHINLDYNKISKLFNLNSVFIEFFKSGLLFNDNISLNTSISVNSNKKNNFFSQAKIYLNILNGKVNLDGTRLINKNIGSLELNDSNLFFQNDRLVLNTNLFFDIKSPDHLFSFLNTNKKLRKEINNVFVNLDYDLLNNEIKFNNVKINNNKTSDQFMNIIEGFKDNDLNNLVKTRTILNELLGAYDG
ncbi:hypothetical protein N8824_04025 [Candidatus Pelagibacter sp.]|nr:hypothetical protein [Candidatus Pelagibacter sp.]